MKTFIAFALILFISKNLVAQTPSQAEMEKMMKGKMPAPQAAASATTISGEKGGGHSRTQSSTSIAGVPSPLPRASVCAIASVIESFEPPDGSTKAR